MKISVIIPTFNEEKSIVGLINYLKQNVESSCIEIIVVDGRSGDDTVNFARKAGAFAFVAQEKGRGAQLHAGAMIATSDVFYFLHADVYPPKTFYADILQAVEAGYDFGRYRTVFKTNKWYLRLNAFFSRFDFFVCYGGDQSLFVTRTLYHQSKGYRTDMHIMEDFEFTARLKTHGRYKIFHDYAVISDRKYKYNSWLRVQLTNYRMIRMYRKGATQQEMIRQYKQMLK